MSAGVDRFVGARVTRRSSPTEDAYPSEHGPTLGENARTAVRSTSPSCLRVAARPRRLSLAQTAYRARAARTLDTLAHVTLLGKTVTSFAEYVEAGGGRGLEIAGQRS